MKKTTSSLGVVLGKNIADRRIALGLTQAQLAEQLGADTVTISRFERGNHLPSLQRLEKIADMLGVPLAELLSQSTNLCTDQSLTIQTMLSGLSEADRRLVLEMVQAYSTRLKTK